MRMSEEFCAGVKILLKRMESNPDEFINPNEYKWQSVVTGVIARKEGRAGSEGAGAVRGLTDAEINALYEGFVKLARPAFDEYVMKNVLDDKEELRYKATERYAHGMTDPSIYQNAIQPGSWQTVTTQTSNTSVVNRIKKGLGL
jgi:hypothetical protein